jgi:phosphoglycolate phosphatase
MKSTYRLVVFDWEGTLADSLGQILKAITHEAKESGLGDVDLELARRVIVLGPVVALKKLFPHLSAHQLSELLQAAQKKMLMNSDDICITTGATEVLNQLKHAGLQLAIATNKGQQSLSRDLVASGLYPLFDATRSASQAPAKPCPQMLEEIMDECGVGAEETLMVGDSVSDIEMAVQIGVKAIGIDLYHQNESSLVAAGADVVFDNFFQLLDYLSLKKMPD